MCCAVRNRGTEESTAFGVSLGATEGEDRSTKMPGTPPGRTLDATEVRPAGELGRTGTGPNPTFPEAKPARTWDTKKKKLNTQKGNFSLSAGMEHEILFRPLYFFALLFFLGLLLAFSFCHNRPSFLKRGGCRKPTILPDRIPPGSAHNSQPCPNGYPFGVAPSIAVSNLSLHQAIVACAESTSPSWT